MNELLKSAKLRWELDKYTDEQIAAGLRLEDAERLATRYVKSDEWFCALTMESYTATVESKWLRTALITISQSESATPAIKEYVGMTLRHLETMAAADKRGL